MATHFNKLLALLSFAILAISSAQSAFGADPDWFIPLRQQLADSEKCMVESVVSSQQSMDGDNKVEQAEVQCEDGRTISAIRSGKNAQFKFEMK